MKPIRVALRLILFVLASTSFFLLLWAGKLLFSPSKRQMLWWRRIILNGWGRTMAMIIGMNIEVAGPCPRPPFFLVSNHLSYVDIIVYAAFLDCVFVSRSDIAGWLGIGLLARSVGTIFLHRENIHDIPRVIGLINQNLDRGLGVIVFPEGTSTMGDAVRPFKPSLLEPAARASYPVSYAAISYRTPPEEVPAYQAICWWGETTFVPHLISLLKVRRFDAYVSFGDHAIQADDRKVLARNLWAMVSTHFVPMTDSPALDRREKI